MIKSVQNSTTVANQTDLSLSATITNFLSTQYQGQVKDAINDRIAFSIVMLAMFLLVYRYIKKKAARTMLVFIFIFTCMVESAGALGIFALILTGDAAIGSLAGGVVGGFIAYWALQDRGFIE